MNLSKFEAQSSTRSESSRYYSFRWWRGFALGLISPRITCVLHNGVPLQLQELGLNLGLLSALLSLHILLISDSCYSCEILPLVLQGDTFNRRTHSKPVCSWCSGHCVCNLSGPSSDCLHFRQELLSLKYCVKSRYPCDCFEKHSSVLRSTRYSLKFFLD